MNGTARFPGAPFWVALLLVGLAGILAARGTAPPTARPVDAPADTFSGQRAAALLKELLGDETPHPVGSAANHAVRDRLLDVLTRMGLHAQVQKTVGCGEKWPVCANVENVIAEIPGGTGDALVLMAHYDSVPPAPGAADDGAGVVTVLESARALLQGPPGRNRILLLFTDAEEPGLLGAEAFFTRHPLAASVKAVVNVEGSGSGGPSLLLRASRTGGQLLNAYRDSATSPVAVSYAQEVFARMPNDTDFTVPDRAGIPSIDFAFGFEFNHYHTPLDTVANLDIRTLQHHGDNVLPIARSLAAADLSRTEPDYAYMTLGQRVWITWPAPWSVWLAVLALVLLGTAAYRAARRESWSQLGAGSLLGLLSVILAVGVCYGSFWIADRLLGTTVRFPANPWPWRLLMIAGAFAPAGLLAWWARDRIGFWSRWVGAWSVLGLLALALAIVAPLAANLLLVPLLVVAVVINVLLFSVADRPVLNATSAGLVLMLVAYVLIGIAIPMEESQGLRLAGVVYVNLALIAPALLAFRCDGRHAAALLAVLPLAWIWAILTPLYSDWRPQSLSLLYLLDLDAQSAHWIAVAENPLPGPVSAALGETISEQPIVPWAPSSRFPSAAAPAITATPPLVAVARTGSRIRIEVRSQGSGDFVQLLLPVTAGVTELAIAGQPVPVSERDGYVRGTFFANGDKPVVFELTVTTAGPVEGYVVDGSHTLPAIAAPISAARGSLAVPQHQGDQQLVYRRVRF